MYAFSPPMSTILLLPASVQAREGIHVEEWIHHCQSMKYREVVNKLMRLGCQELPRRGRGSHRKWFNPGTNRATVLPDWGAKDLKIGTIRAALRQLGIDWEDFERG